MEEKMTKLGTINENTPHGNSFDSSALKSEITNRKIADSKKHLDEDYKLAVERYKEKDEE